jgi:hypothetical protein
MIEQIFFKKTKNDRINIFPTMNSHIHQPSKNIAPPLPLLWRQSVPACQWSAGRVPPPAPSPVLGPSGAQLFDPEKTGVTFLPSLWWNELLCVRRTADDEPKLRNRWDWRTIAAAMFGWRISAWDWDFLPESLWAEGVSCFFMNQRARKGLWRTKDSYPRMEKWHHQWRSVPMTGYCCYKYPHLQLKIWAGFKSDTPDLGLKSYCTGSHAKKWRE